MMNMAKKVALAGAIAVSAAMALGLQAQAQEYKWELAEDHVEDSLPGALDKKFAQIMAEKSGGRIQITPHFGASIGFRTTQHVDMVSSGAVQLANTPIHTHGGSNAFLELGSLPFLAKTPAHARLLFNSNREKYDEVLESLGLKLVAVAAWTPVGLWSTKPLNTVDDLKGMTIRTIDVGALVMFKELGANPVNLPFTEIIPALSTNAINGVSTSGQAGNTVGLGDYAKYYTELDSGVQWNTLHMNLDLFNSLPADLQSLIIETGKQLSEESFDNIQAVIDQSYADLRAKGVNVTEKLDPAFQQRLEDAAKSVEERWVERVPDGKAILEAYRAQIQN